MKLIIRITYCFLILLSSVIISFGAYAETNSSSSDDIWITFCLINFDPGKEIDECLNMGGIYNERNNRTKDFKVLPREKSESLELILSPTSEPVPLVIGHYWKCIHHKESGFDSCKPVLVICKDDKSKCVTVGD